MAVLFNDITQRRQAVAVTGHGQPEDLERSTAAGFDAHLVKPVDRADVEAVLSRLAGG